MLYGHASYGATIAARYFIECHSLEGCILAAPAVAVALLGDLLARQPLFWTGSTVLST